MNLRKDHCRTLHGRTTRELVNKPRGVGAARGLCNPMLGARALSRPPGKQLTPGAVRAKESKRRSVCRPPRSRVLDRITAFQMCAKRLSATDISALASMKNVAKCDTWCELQNPVNHRVFERKLRPKPSG